MFDLLINQLHLVRGCERKTVIKLMKIKLPYTVILLHLHYNYSCQGGYVTARVYLFDCEQNDMKSYV